MKDDINITEQEQITVIHNGIKHVRVKNMKPKTFDMPNAEGEQVYVPGVYFMVIGQNHSWPDWMEYEKFKVANPDLEITF